MMAFSEWLLIIITLAVIKHAFTYSSVEQNCYCTDMKVSSLQYFHRVFADFIKKELKIFRMMN